MKKRVLFVALALFSFAAFFSCSNAAGGSDSESSKPSSASASKKPGYVTLTGTVSVSGAVPKILSDNYDSSSDNGGVSRSAQPGINTSGDGATMEYFARATSGDLVSEGAFGSGAEAKMFGLELQAGIEWTIVVGVREKSTQKPIPARTVYLSSTWKVKPDPAAPTISHNFVPVPNTSGGTGSIALKIKYSPSLYEITPKFVDGPSGFEALNDENWTKLEKSDGWIFQLSGVKSGKYELCLDFKVKSTNEIVYSTIQSVTVANGMTTDSWVADSSSSAVSPISASGEFNFNSNASTLMAAFLGTNLFVGKVSDDCDAPADTNSGNYLSPLATVTAAVEKIASFGNKDSDYFVRVSGTVGAMGSRLPADIESISKSSNAKSLTIIGTSGSNADCIKTASAANPAVKVSTDVPVTFKNIKIMGVSGGMGSGMAISAFGGSNVTIDEGCLITGGKVGVSVTGDSTKVTMKGGSFSGNDADVYLASEKVLTVDCNLSDVADKGIVVSLQSWTRGTQFIESGEHLSAITEDIVKKFDFTKTGWDTPIYDSDKKAKIDADIYVAASGKDSETVDGITVENTIGNKNYPFASIKQASKYLDASHGTIYVKGSVSGAQEIPSTVASTCTAIKLTGLSDLPTSGTNAYVPSDEINAGGAVGAGTALKVATSVPVTIENLKITGGSATNGGGIYVSVKGASLTLSTGVNVTANTASANGGGVYFAGTNASGGTANLIMQGTAKIGGNTATNCGGGVYLSYANLCMSGSALIGETGSSITSAATSGSKSNSAASGGGIYLATGGKLRLGYASASAASGTTLSADYGVRHNYASNMGGGIYANGDVDFASGAISYNGTAAGSGNHGGGIYTYSGTFTMSGGTIAKNKGYYGGGVYAGGTFNMTSGTIGDSGASSAANSSSNCSNYAASLGGGVYISGGGEFSGGYIAYNYAQSGGGINVSGSNALTVKNTVQCNGASGRGTGIYDSGNLTLDGSVKFYLNNIDIIRGKTITLGSSYAQNNISYAPTVTLNTVVGTGSWDLARLLTPGSGTTLPTAYNKIALSSTDSAKYKINSKGYLLPISSTPMQVSDAAVIETACAALASGDTLTMEVTAPITPTSLNVPAGAQLTLKRSTDLSADVNNTSMSYMLKLNGKTVGSNDSGDLILDGGSTGGFKCYSPLVSGGGKMHHVTIRNNDSTKSDYSGTNPGNAGSGGAFFVGAGESLSLYNCTISNCHAEYGGAIYAYGEVYLYNTDTISNCSATEYGGALYLNAAPANTNRNGTIYASITGCSVTSYSNHGARIYAKGYSGSTYAFTYSGTNYSATSSAPVTIE